MRKDEEKKHLLRALDAFKRKLIVISHDFDVLAANSHAAVVCSENLIGQRCHKALYGRETPCPNCPAIEVLKNREPALRDIRNSTLNSERISCLYSYPVKCGDITEAMVVLDFEFPSLEGLEEQLQRSNAFFRRLIRSAVDGVIAADKSGKIIIFNDAAAELSGYGVEEALENLNIRDVYPGDGAYEIMRKLRSTEYGDKGKLKGFHVDVVAKSGELIPISLYASIIYEEDKEIATIGFFHDLRERIKMQKELEKAQIQLMQSEKMASLGKLAAGVAHQLNNPLGSITLYSKLIMEENELSDSVRKDLQRILKDAQRCRDTVKELLEFARQTRQFMKPTDINVAISRTLFLLESQTLFQNISIQKNLQSDLPLVFGDIQQLNHVFMNIILNAAQAMEGKGTLMIETVADVPNGVVKIEISDTGPGIPMDVMPHIFDPFFTTKEEGKGTGLGLSMVYGIVQNHQGEIRALNREGGGTCFFVELPIAGADKRGDTGGN